MKRGAAGTIRRYDGSSGLRCGALGLLLALSLLVACGKPAVLVRPPKDGSSATPTANPAGRTASGAAHRNAARNAIPRAHVDCGTFVLSQGGRTPEAAYRCFIEAVGSGRLARLKETALTTEGDPIPVTYVGDSLGKVEMTTDSRQDRFGTKNVLRYICSGPTAEQTWMTFKKCSPARRIG
jgi:hypothetical protein